MTHIDLQSDAFHQLLTDALRAGPGSPEWHQAVTMLRSAGAGQEADEYQLLITAREHLESGKDYRSVRAGPEFTRRVLAEIEQATVGTSPLRSPATWIAGLAAVVLVGALAAVIYFTRPASLPEDGAAMLARTYFVEPLLSSDFRDELPAEWRPIGGLAVIASERGLRLGSEETDRAGSEGGGVVSAEPITPPFAFEAQLRGRVGHDIVPQVFISESADFSPERATSVRELTWMLNDGRPVVALPDGRFEGQGEPVRGMREPYTVRILIGPHHAIVESGGQRLWSGEHQLDPAAPRYVGVRFLRKDGDRKDRAEWISFPQVRILLPQKAD